MIKLSEANLRIPQFARPVYVVAGGCTDFRKRYPEKSTPELCIEAANMAAHENDLKVDLAELKALTNFCVYSQFADHFGDQLLAAAKVHDYLGFDPLGNVEVKTGGATGGSSVLVAANFVASGYADLVPVIGWERMDEVNTRQGNAYIASAACKDFESELGWMYATYYALMAQRYIHEYGLPRDAMAKIAVKNHGYACESPFSQSPMHITEQEVIENKFVSVPLTFLECCQMSTGGACLILASEEMAYRLTDQPIKLSGIASGTHTLRTADRRDMPVLLLPHEDLSLYEKRTNEWPGFTSFLGARYAARLAYGMAGIQDPMEDLDILETHDAFTISDIQTYEDIGLRPYGEGADFVLSGDCYLEGKLPTNLSGGLIGTMHAVGATGIWQIIEVLWQLQGKWAKFHAEPKMWERFGKEKPEDFRNLQVENPKKGATVSHAGTGSHITVAILEKE